MTDNNKTTASGPETAVANKYNISELKSTCDEALRQYFEKKGFKERHTHTDVKLLLGYTGVLFCVIDFLYSWKNPFKSTKWFSYISVTVFTLTAILTVLYSFFVQRDTFYVGHSEEKGVVISAGSSVKAHEPEYHLTLSSRPIQVEKPRPVPTSLPRIVVKPFSTWFHEDGKLNRELFEAEIENALDALFKLTHKD
ncbi:hypothetical protein H4219_002688 [Mycoemilia scoparia]|uniref:Signal peptidase complex subunit 2 n=1 Tax=Mycoemilia scoparia TaxID=417184 RepID=A0A9W8DU17_9FUNG|nr:hypothetical protein H4219_002688 [Mycoemilia scoparia]